MIYVERNGDGQIRALRRHADQPGMERKDTIDAEVLEFLQGEESDASLLNVLAATDLGILRILDDIIDLLIHKNIIMFTELPEEAQKKLTQRRRLREKIGRESIIVEYII